MAAAKYLSFNPSVPDAVNLDECITEVRSDCTLFPRQGGSPAGSRRFLLPSSTCDLLLRAFTGIESWGLLLMATQLPHLLQFALQLRVYLMPNARAFRGRATERDSGGFSHGSFTTGNDCMLNSGPQEIHAPLCALAL
ncbi:eukaryotic translation initiation factor [Cyclospora cayetanensis]|uniref:Eukaryotic translation initiation factor n=1 Tax=Cyclospora cayetanensis TaxID=88456 RepID=A0A1D3D519_9EIME|nr:eukaryotic translation initiation factor [Cyclospora cayetanensis]